MGGMPREVREETGLDVSRGRLAAMDFRRPKPGRPGGIRFLFDCGHVSDKALASLTLQPEEISESRLAPLPDALALLRGPIRRRIRAATRSRRLVYREDGRPVLSCPRGRQTRGDQPPHALIAKMHRASHHIVVAITARRAL